MTNYLTDQKPKLRRLLVTELEHVVLIRDGLIGPPLTPGRHRVRPRKDRIWREQATPQVTIVPSQEVLTSDGATVRVTVSALVRVVKPEVTMVAGDWHSRWHLEAQHALRAAVTGATLEDLIANRSGLDDSLKDSLTIPATQLGIEIQSLGLRDLVVAGDLKNQMADVVAARLAGQAALERARGESAALRNLANAASLLKDNPELYRLRLLQEIASSSGNTFVVDTKAPPPAG
jgi:regulator of protease activity HflC (stomatin/prohibitin superfamily)